eukprot:TCONS_00029882-protein
MLKILTGLAFLIFAINFGQDYEGKSLVSAEPVQNQKHVHNEIQDFLNLDDRNDEEDEVLVRVKRSPDPNPQPRGGRGGGFRGGSRYRGGSTYRGGSYGSSGGGNLSTGAILGIVFGILGGCAVIAILMYLCSK